jgi:hypothetical protein
MMISFFVFDHDHLGIQVLNTGAGLNYHQSLPNGQKTFLMPKKTT